MLFDDTVDHRVEETETMHQDAFIVSNNRGNIRRETTNGWVITIKRKYVSTTYEGMNDVKE